MECGYQKEMISADHTVGVSASRDEGLGLHFPCVALLELLEPACEMN